MQQFFRIGEAAKALGVAPSALRYYERRGIVSPPERVNGQRRYTQAQIQQLAALRLSQQSGFSLIDVQQVFTIHDAELFGTAWRARAEQKLGEIDQQISRLKDARRIVEESLTCLCTSLATCHLIQDVLRITGS